MSTNYKQEEEIELIESTTYQIKKSEDFYCLGHSIESLIVNENSTNTADLRQLVISDLKQLRAIQIHNNNFLYVRNCTFTNLPALKTLVSGEKCFLAKECESEYFSGKANHFSLTNCEALSSLTIGDYSFEKYTKCKIESMPSFSFSFDLPKLFALHIGTIYEDPAKECRNFLESTCFLCKLTSLREVYLGNNVFMNCHGAVFLGCPNLEIIELGNRACQGSDSAIVSLSAVHKSGLMIACILLACFVISPSQIEFDYFAWSVELLLPSGMPCTGYSFS